MGFFFQESGKTKAASKREIPIKLLHEQGCKACPLDTIRLTTPKMKPAGAEQPVIYILGEGPSEDDDRRGQHFSGKIGEILRRTIPPTMANQIRWNNVIRCKTPDGRGPTGHEMECCRNFQAEDIERTKPAAVFGFGNAPLSWSGIAPSGVLNVWRGKKIPVRVGTHTFWYFPMIPPSFFDDNESASDWLDIFERDLNEAFKEVRRGLEAPYVEENFMEGVVWLQNYGRKGLDEVKGWLDLAVDEPDIGLDIETKNLRPYNLDSKILSIAFSNGDSTYAFPVRHREARWTPAEHKSLDQMIQEFLVKSGRKHAHNAKFEQEWLSFFYGQEVLYETEWVCTQAQSFVLDERPGAHGLDNRTVALLGFNVKSLSNLDRTRLDDYPLAEVLPYNGLDAKYCLKISSIQAKAIRESNLEKVFHDQNSRNIPLVIAQQRGIPVDQNVAETLAASHKEKLTNLISTVMALPDVQNFAKKYGQFSPNTPADVVRLLRDELHLIDGTSSDESILATVEHPVAKAILEMRGTEKLLSTYLLPYTAKENKYIYADGMIHTNYNPHLARTRRLSSDDPNMQNWPKHKGIEILGMVVAPEGLWVVSFDYGQIEARLIAMASKDAFLVKALWENYDIHMEWAERISRAYPAVIGGVRFFKDKEVMKDFRQTVKNQWVFPAFYGSVAKSLARNLNLPEDVAYREYDQFWKVFAGAKKWQEQMVREAKRQGYVESLTGFRRHLPMSPTEIINTPIQGAASDIVVEAMDRLSYKAYKSNMPQWQPRMNIHDDLKFWLPDETLEDDVDVIGEEMCKITYPFVNVPIVVEVSIGKSWLAQEEIGKYKSTDYGHTR